LKLNIYRHRFPEALCSIEQKRDLASSADGSRDAGFATSYGGLANRASWRGKLPNE